MERKSERELVVTRTLNAPARLVFEAWTRPESSRRWWVPKSAGMSLLSCEADVRVGGGYRLEFGLEGAKTMAFFGRYIAVTPHSRLVWTNEESNDGAITTLTFEESGGKTLLVMHEAYPSKEALDAAIEGMEAGCPSHSRNWTSFSSPWARAGKGHEAVHLAPACRCVGLPTDRQSAGISSDSAYLRQDLYSGVLAVHIRCTGHGGASDVRAYGQSICRDAIGRRTPVESQSIVRI